MAASASARSRQLARGRRSSLQRVRAPASPSAIRLLFSLASPRLGWRGRRQPSNADVHCKFQIAARLPRNRAGATSGTGLRSDSRRICTRRITAIGQPHSRCRQSCVRRSWFLRVLPCVSLWQGPPWALSAGLTRTGPAFFNHCASGRGKRMRGVEFSNIALTVIAIVLVSTVLLVVVH